MLNENASMSVRTLPIVIGILVDVVGGIAGVNSVHDLHNMVGFGAEFFFRFAARQGFIRIQRFTDMYVGAGFVAKQFQQPLTRTERNRHGNNRLVVAYRVFEYRFF